jgi:Domain of unknown function (DUF4397)
MKRVLALVAALGMLVLVPATPLSADVSHPLADALVRVAHFSPDTAGVDVWVDGARVLRNVGYDTVSDYVPLASGEHQFALRPYGASATSKPILSASAALVADDAYTIAGVGLNKDLRGQIFQDNLGAPPAGRAKVRVIDAAVGTSPIDVALSGGAHFDNVGFPNSSVYEAVAPSTYGVSVTNNGKAMLTVPNVVVGAGIIYSFVVIGGGGKPLQLVPVVDARAPAVTPVGAAKTGGGGTARVFVHPAVLHDADHGVRRILL